MSAVPGPPDAALTALVLVGAGESRRMGGTDKVFAPLGRRPLLYYPLRAAHECPLVDHVVLVLSAANLERGRRLVHRHGFSKVLDICTGGATRRDSVSAGLARLHGCRWVLVHDASRPFLTPALIEDGLEAASDTGAAVAAVPVKDTIKVAGAAGTVTGTPDRSTLWAAQTPQVFRFDIIARAYQLPGEATDDASLVERLGCRVKLYDGSGDNIKVTTPEDLALARVILRQKQCG